MKINKAVPWLERRRKKTLDERDLHYLKKETKLNGRYIIKSVLGEGGFGITYYGEDDLFGNEVAIKEFFPQGIVTRNNEYTDNVTVTYAKQDEAFLAGKKRFIGEARVMAKFNGDQGIVNVTDFFEANNTAYIVMEYLDGITLKEYLKGNRQIPVDELMGLLAPLLESLDDVHQSGLIHRDISPDNIMVLKDGSVKLMDFGAARDYTEFGEKSLSIVLKPGYAPAEQYQSRGVQGPWTDIYALCATIYKCITGKTPEDSIQRVMEDDLKKPSELGVDISPQIEKTLLKGMSIAPKDRYQNLKDLCEDLYKDYMEEEESLDESPIEAEPAETLEKNSAGSQKISERKSEIPKTSIESQESFEEGTESFKKEKDLVKDSEKEHLQKNSEIFKEDTQPESLKEYNTVSVKHNFEENAGESTEIKMQKGDAKEADSQKNSQDSLEQTPKKRSKKGLLIAVILCLLIAGGGYHFYQKSLEREVPNLVNKSFDSAKAEAAGDDDSLILVELDQAYSDTVKKGNIISQDIKAGTILKKGDTIRVTVSKGALVTIPDVAGKKKAKAKEMITNAKLIMKVSDRKWSDKVAKGKVISQDKKAGEKIEEGNTISVVISKGVEQVKVPKVEGKTLEEAQKALKKAKLKVDSSRTYSSSVEEGKIISQSIASGTTVDKNTTVKVAISLGKEPEPEPVYRSTSSSSSSGSSSASRKSYSRSSSSSRKSSSSSSSRKSSGSKKKSSGGGDSINNWNLVN